MDSRDNSSSVRKLLFDGSYIYVDTRDTSLAQHIVRDGYWEKWVTDAFLDVIQAGMTVLDIGAHCGYYTFLAAKKVGPRGYVYAFEPNPMHHATMNASLLENGYHHATLMPVAVAATDGVAHLFIPDTLTGSASLHGSFDAKYKVKELAIRTVVLDHALPQDCIPDVLKIDIEGSEPYIMDGLFNVLDRCPSVTIFMEYSPAVWRSIGFDPLPILSRFEDAGFTFTRLIPSGGREMLSVIDLVANTYPDYLDLMLERSVPK